MSLSVTSAPVVPVVPGLPFLGSAVALARDPAAFFLRCYRELGPVFRMRLPGQHVTVLTGPEVGRFMGSRQGQAALRSKETWQGVDAEYGAERSLISSDGAEHRQLREVMRRGYSREALAGRLDELVAVTDACLDREWPVGRRVPVLDALQRLVVNQLGGLLLGHVPVDHVDDVRFVLRRMLTVHVTRQRPKVLLRLPDYRRAKARFLGLGGQAVAVQRTDAVAPGQRLLVEALLTAHDDGVLNRRDLEMAILGPYVAGMDTVANTLGGLVYLVLKHPDVLERIRAEVDVVFARPTLDDDVLADLPVTQGTVQEAMRLYPIAVAQPRTAAVDFEYAGDRISAGEPVYCAVTVPHFLEEFFPDPMRFDVDRYSPERREHARPGAYSPFGRGPHTCLGKGIADIQMTLTAARLFHRLDLALDPAGYVLRRKAAPTPGPATSFRVAVTAHRRPARVG